MMYRIVYPKLSYSLLSQCVYKQEHTDVLPVLRVW